MSDTNKDKAAAPVGGAKAKTDVKPAPEKGADKDKGSCGSCS